MQTQRVEHPDHSFSKHFQYQANDQSHFSHPINLPIIDATESKQKPKLRDRYYEGPEIKKWFLNMKRCPMTNTPRRLHALKAAQPAYLKRRDQFLRAHPKYFHNILPSHQLKGLQIISEPQSQTLDLHNKRRSIEKQHTERKQRGYRPGTYAF